MKLSRESSNIIFINNESLYSSYSIYQIIYPIIILSLGLTISMLFYSIYNYCQKKENSQYAFLSVFKSLKEWREKLSIYQNIISEIKEYH